MVNNSIDTNKTNNHLSPSITVWTRIH